MIVLLPVLGHGAACPTCHDAYINRIDPGTPSLDGDCYRPPLPVPQANPVATATLTLPVSAAILQNWLEHETSAAFRPGTGLGATRETGRALGSGFRLALWPVEPDAAPGVHLHLAPGAVYLRQPFGYGVSCPCGLHRFEPTGIAHWFELLPLGSERTRLTASLYVEAARPLFERLLEGMRRELAPGLPQPDARSPDPPAQGTPTPAAETVAKPRLPRTPSRPADLQKWRSVWRDIKTEWEKTGDYASVDAWLQEHRTDVSYSQQVIADIIRAGTGRLLD
ncbi:MAG: hypothetical protein HY689_04115 [Chloroflexi bacterium]|nr:hypothetical protein [Chloroflexota bacterium]